MRMIKSVARRLEALGLRVFRLSTNAKEPYRRGWHEEANRTQLDRFWTEKSMYNIGLAMGDDFVGVDIDCKNGKNGELAVLDWAMEGWELPETFEQRTPSGGRHLVYATPSPVSNTAGKLAEGIDIRGKGGYLVGAGSTTPQGTYTANYKPPVPAPDWLLALIRKADERPVCDQPPLVQGGNQEDVDRAIRWLLNQPVTQQGQIDPTLFHFSAHLAELGLDDDQIISTLEAAFQYEGEIDDGHIELKVKNARSYAKSRGGSLAPEAEFDPVPPASGAEAQKPAVEDPVAELNKEYAHVLIKGTALILWETRDWKNKPITEHLSLDAFESKMENRRITLGDSKSQPLSRFWRKHPDRRSYDGICFAPERECNPRFYNVWRGFAVPALVPGMLADPIAHRGLASFLEHTWENVCQKNDVLYKYIMGYVAHMFQKPWEKPLTALVIRGSKGNGKTAWVNIIGKLLGSHYMKASNDRYLVGNFNAHLEGLILFVLEEAHHAGDKRTEGILKDVTTGDTINIERKGCEKYEVDNLLRLVILGNQDRIVPTSSDERRWAVYTMGNGRILDTKFFERMRLDMEAGGYSVLLRYFLDYDLKGFNVNVHPQSEGLFEQKMQSLEFWQEWWLDCLSAGRIVDADFSAEWPEAVPKDQLRGSYSRFLQKRRARGRELTAIQFSKKLFEMCPSAFAGEKTEGGKREFIFKLPTLEEARGDWDKLMKGTSGWDR